MYKSQIKINNNLELKNTIPFLKSLIDTYCERPHRRREYAIMPTYWNIRHEVRKYYKEQFKHEKEQTDLILEQIENLMRHYVIVSETHKNIYRHPKDRTCTDIA